MRRPAVSTPHTYDHQHDKGAECEPERVERERSDMVHRGPLEDERDSPYGRGEEKKDLGAYLLLPLGHESLPFRANQNRRVGRWIELHQYTAGPVVFRVRTTGPASAECLLCAACTLGELRSVLE